MSRVRFPRGAAGDLPARASDAPAVLLTGPPGAGKTTLLVETAAALRADGWEPIYLDLLGAASSPERFVRAPPSTRCPRRRARSGRRRWTARWASPPAAS